MTLRALLLVVAALVAAPAALADGGPIYTMQGGSGIAATSGGFRFVAIPTSTGDTTLVTIAKGGSVWNWSPLAGSYGIPMVTFRDAGGLSRDGRTLILQSPTYGGPVNTSFVVVDTRNLTAQGAFFLHGTWAFDALSPDASRLYLTQHVSTTNLSRYVVREYDLRTGHLLPGRIADRTQRSWVMQGDAMTRTVSPGGRWVYTLYQNPGGYPFIHALDTVRGVAHCIGLPWHSTADQTALANVVLALRGSRLAVHWRSGRPWLNVDTRTWRVTAAPSGGFPSLWLTPLAALLLVPVELLRRRRRNTPVSIEGGSHDPPARVRPRLPRRSRLRTRGILRLPGSARHPGWLGHALRRRHAQVRGDAGRRRHVAAGDPAQ
jgi:hypothetical protein